MPHCLTGGQANTRKATAVLRFRGIVGLILTIGLIQVSRQRPRVESISDLDCDVFGNLAVQLLYHPPWGRT